ncbi:MAG: hypothetical protein IIA53_10010, partial [Chloroflexi bacterium]|nr:hypothetical protein [Chloroflexota bacterium]
MNHSESRLRTNPRIVPPDLLLKFGYSPSGGIEFDSAAQTLSFYQGGTKRVDINSFGLAVRNGEGLVVGHTAQLSIGGGIQEFQVIGASFDAEMAVATFRNDAFGPGFRFLKSRATTPGDNVADPGTYNDGDDLGFIRWHVDDGADYASYAAQIFVEADDTAFAENDVPGRMIFATTPDGAASPTEALRIDSSQNVQMRSESVFWIGPDSAATGFVDANTTVGLVINQEANTDQAITLKQSGVAHPITANTETDTYARFTPALGASGGLGIEAYSDAGATLGAFTLFLGAFAGDTTLDTTDTSSSSAPLVLSARKSNGGTGTGDVADTENMIAMVNGNGNTVRWLIKGNGDVHQTTDAHTALDEWDDAMLLRAYSQVTAPDVIIRDKWDEWVDYNEPDLIAAGV